MAAMKLVTVPTGNLKSSDLEQVTSKTINLLFKDMLSYEPGEHYDFPLHELVDKKGERRYLEVGKKGIKFNEGNLLRKHAKNFNKNSNFLAFLPVDWLAGCRRDLGAFVFSPYSAIVNCDKEVVSITGHELGHLLGLKHHSGHEDNEKIMKEIRKHPAYHKPFPDDPCIMDTPFTDDLAIQPIRFCKPCRDYLAKRHSNSKCFL